MKTLTIEQLENTTGGGFLSGFCWGVSAVRAGAMLGIYAINPVAGGVMTGVVLGCLAYTAYKALS